MALSNLGIFHTAIGIIAIVAAVKEFISNGKIDLGNRAGKIYLYFTIVSSLTALGLSSVHGVNPGHILALLIVVLVLVAWFLYIKRPGFNRSRYFETFFLSFSFFLSMIPTINETLTRVPLRHPLATGPTDPLIAKTLLALLIVFVIGSVLQFRKQRKINRLL